MLIKRNPNGIDLPFPSEITPREVVEGRRAFLARAATDGSAIVAPPLVVGSNLIFQTQNGTVTAIAVE